MKNPVESNKIIVLLSLIQILFFCTYVSADIVSIGTGGKEISLGYGSQVDLFFAGSDIINPIISIITPIDGYRRYDYVSGSVFLFVNASVVDINLDSCWYEVIGAQIISNTSFNCSNGYNNFDFSVSTVGEYNLTVHVNDSANNQNSSTISFSVSAYTGPQQGGGHTLDPADKGTPDFNLYNKTIMCKKISQFLESKTNYTQNQREDLKNNLAIIFGFPVSDFVLDEYLENFEENCIEPVEPVDLPDDTTVDEDSEDNFWNSKAFLFIIIGGIVIFIILIILLDMNYLVLSKRKNHS